MIEMEYKNERSKALILNSGVYKSHKFYVISLGTHPTAYIECNLVRKDGYCNRILDPIEVHWGLTYSGEDYWNEENDGNNYIGWDYAHAYDWAGYNNDEVNRSLGNKKHTTQEMTAECYRAIDALVKIEEDEASIDRTDRQIWLSDVQRWLEGKLEDGYDPNRETVEWLLREMWRIE